MTDPKKIINSLDKYLKDYSGEKDYATSKYELLDNFYDLKKNKSNKDSYVANNALYGLLLEKNNMKEKSYKVFGDVFDKGLYNNGDVYSIINSNEVKEREFSEEFKCILGLSLDNKEKKEEIYSQIYKSHRSSEISLRGILEKKLGKDYSKSYEQLEELKQENGFVRPYRSVRPPHKFQLSDNLWYGFFLKEIGKDDEVKELVENIKLSFFYNDGLVKRVLYKDDKREDNSIYAHTNCLWGLLLKEIGDEEYKDVIKKLENSDLILDNGLLKRSKNQELVLSYDNALWGLLNSDSKSIF